MIVSQRHRTGLICVISFLTFLGANLVLRTVVPVHSPPSKKKLSFIETCAHGSLETVTALIDHGTDVNQTTERGFTPLMAAADGERLDIAALLLVRGANPHARTKFGVTALYYAAANAHADVAKLLLDYGVRANEDKSALGYALLNDCSPTIKLLVEHGADVNVVDDKTGRTSLMWAAQWTAADNVKLMIEHGAKVNVHMKGDMTALMFAACVLRAENVRVLLDAGADVNVVSQQQGTALAMAESEASGANSEAVELLKRAGAKK